MTRTQRPVEIARNVKPFVSPVVFGRFAARETCLPLVSCNDGNLQARRSVCLASAYRFCRTPGESHTAAALLGGARKDRASGRRRSWQPVARGSGDRAGRAMDVRPLGRTTDEPRRCGPRLAGASHRPARVFAPALRQGR